MRRSHFRAPTAVIFDGRAAAAPARTQITHVCEEGWSAIAQWTGVPLRAVLEAAGMLPTARFVVLYCCDDWLTSIDMIDALHPQTILAYGMNGPTRSGCHPWRPNLGRICSLEIRDGAMWSFG